MGTMQMKFMRPAFLFGVAAITLLSIQSAWAEVKIGIAGPETGKNQFTGEQQLAGAQKAVDIINAAGGLLGQQIVAVSVDDACDPKQAEAAARQLVSEGVIVVIGHVCSGASIAAQKIYEPAGIIMISPASTNPRFTDEGGPHTFRVIGRDDLQGALAGNFLADTHTGSRIAFFHDGTLYGQGLAEETRKQLNKRGVTEIMFESYVPGQPDYAPLIEKLAAAKADVLYVGGYSSDIGIIIRQAKKQLPGLQLFSGDTLATVDFLITAGEAGEGTRFTFGPDIRLKPEASSVVAAFEQDGYDPGGKTLYSYAAVQAWAQAVQQTGSFDTPDVIATLHRGEFETVLGHIGFDEKGDVTGAVPFVWYVMGKDNFGPAN